MKLLCAVSAVIGVLALTLRPTNAESAKARFPRGEFGITLGDSIESVDKIAHQLKFIADEGTNVSLPRDSWRHFTLPTSYKYKWMTVTLREKKVADVTLVYAPSEAHPAFQEVLEELRKKFGKPSGISDRQYDAPIEDGAGGQSDFIGSNHNQSAYWFDGRTLVGLHVRRNSIRGLNPIGPEPRELSLKFQDVPPGTTFKVHAERGRTFTFASDLPASPALQTVRPQKQSAR
jgi:hypothetical protein